MSISCFVFTVDNFFFAVVEDIVCVGKEFYVYDAEGCVKWFALLSVKECVSRLFEMGETSQCLQVKNEKHL